MFFSNKSCCSFTNLKAIGKSKEKLIAIAFKSKKIDNYCYCYCNSFKSDNCIKRNRGKKQRRLRAITLQGHCSDIGNFVL